MLLQSYSTVLYLTDSGGPTVVLEQTVSSPLAQAAWLSWPQGNNLLCYPGNLLHGVIPGLLYNLLRWPAHVINPCFVGQFGQRFNSDRTTPGHLTIAADCISECASHPALERPPFLPE